MSISVDFDLRAIKATDDKDREFVLIIRNETYRLVKRDGRRRVSRCQKNKCEKHFCDCGFRKLRSTRKSPPPEVVANAFTGRSIVLLSGHALFLPREHGMLGSFSSRRWPSPHKFTSMNVLPAIRNLRAISCTSPTRLQPFASLKPLLIQVSESG